MKKYPLTEHVVPVGCSVQHRRYGWSGEVARFAHADGRVMVIWDHGGGSRGCSLAAYEDLEVHYERPIGVR